MVNRPTLASQTKEEKSSSLDEGECGPRIIFHSSVRSTGELAENGYLCTTRLYKMYFGEVSGKNKPNMEAWCSGITSDSSKEIPEGHPFDPGSLLYSFFFLALARCSSSFGSSQVRPAFFLCSKTQNAKTNGPTSVLSMTTKVSKCP